MEPKQAMSKTAIGNRRQKYPSVNVAIYKKELKQAMHHRRAYVLKSIKKELTLNNKNNQCY